MSVSYDVFTGAFLAKLTDFDYVDMRMEDRIHMIDEYMMKAFSAFRKNCKYDFFTTRDDVIRRFDVDVPEEDLEEIADIVSDGMLVQWMKPYVYRQENLENALSTKDFSLYSPSSLLQRIGEAYAKAQTDFKQAIREYSYNHGDLTSLHL